MRLWALSRIGALSAIASLTAASLSFAQQPGATSQPISVPKQQTQARSVADRAGVGITFQDGLLSVTAQNRSVHWLASEISSRIGIPIHFSGNIPNDTVSITLQKTPVELALRQIFANYDSFFFYGVEEEGGPSRIMAVWVYPKRVGQGLAPVPPEQWASTKELKAMLKSKDPNLRGQAIQGLAEREGQEATPQILDSLKDESDQVRTQAMYGALKTGITLPDDVLSSAALSDPSPEVRLMALQALASSPSGLVIAENALNDPNEAVRVEAQEIINTSNPNNQPQPPAQSNSAPNP